MARVQLATSMLATMRRTAKNMESSTAPKAPERLAELNNKIAQIEQQLKESTQCQK